MRALERACQFVCEERALLHDDGQVVRASGGETILVHDRDGEAGLLVQRFEARLTTQLTDLMKKRAADWRADPGLTPRGKGVEAPGRQVARWGPSHIREAGEIPARSRHCDRFSR
jgi:hypothetical protein